MILHLIDNNTTVEIFRQNCGHWYKDYRDVFSCNWNINPVELINREAPGFFAIGPWGCDGYHSNEEGRYIRTPEKFEQLIPIRNVLRITRVGEWEKPDYQFLTQEELMLGPDENS